ncbi:Uncharacterized protein FKW44_022555, partial [Caligus rogercresseyi]
DVTSNDIEEIFRHFGSIVEPAKEVVFTEGKLKGLNYGNYILGLRPTQDIPGFLGFKGYKTRVSYYGQTVTCAKCYEKGHFAKD